MATILIGADLCPIERNLPLFEQGNAEGLFTDLLGEFGQADLVIANLECPLITRPSPIQKTGPTFGAPSSCINAIKNAGIHVLGLANNHILDHGSNGLANTLEVCVRAGIETVGAGLNLAAARQILIKEVNGLRIGILAVAEREFSIAGKNSAGANPLDLVDCVRNLQGGRDSYDYLIVLLHGGDEFFVPSPRLKDTCHFLVEMGANAVIVQHPHVLGGCEEFGAGHIVYGQGALLMDEAIYRDRKSFHEGFLVKLSVASDGGTTMEMVPFVQSELVPGARRMPADREWEFRAELGLRSKALQDDAGLEAQWAGFCEANRHSYLSSMLGHNRVLAKLNSGGLLEKLLHGKLPLLRAKNIVACETHREAIETLFAREGI